MSPCCESNISSAPRLRCVKECQEYLGAEDMVPPRRASEDPKLIYYLPELILGPNLVWPMCDMHHRFTCVCVLNLVLLFRHLIFELNIFFTLLTLVIHVSICDVVTEKIRSATIKPGFLTRNTTIPLVTGMLTWILIYIFTYLNTLSKSRLSRHFVVF